MIRFYFQLLACLFLASALLLQSGCATSNVVGKSKTELAQMELQADAARDNFINGKYDEAEKTFLSLSKERTVSQPLYQTELATVYLAKDEKEKAFQQYRAAQVSLESFFDANSEKKAASLWGAESQKVYKGEPYERSSLYLILGLMMLNRNEIDNALACFKSGLLCDSDVEEDRYRSDYALLQFLAAKCCELRDEPEMRDQYIKVALKSCTETHPDAKALVTAKYDTENLPEGQDVSQIVSTLQTIYGEEAAKLMTREDVLSFIEKKINKVCPCDYYKRLTDQFNTLIVVWSGTPPSFVRGGRYGEHRGILPGGLPVSDYEIIHNNMRYGSIRGTGSLSYQATTRGGRLMDNVLSSQASFKGFTNDFGDSLIDAADDVNDPYVMLGLFVTGAIVKGVSAATTVEADIRAWRTLPNEFQVVPMNLAPGNYELCLCAYKYVSPLATEPVSFTIKDGQPVNVVHVFAYEFGKESIATILGMSDSERYPVTLSKAGYQTVDKNGDGELCAMEQSEVMAFILNKFDLNKNGSIDDDEDSSFSSWCLNEFNIGMEKQ